MSSYVELDDKWAITSDSMQWKLCSIVNAENGKRYQAQKYYPNLMLLFKNLYSIMVRTSDYESLADIVENQRTALKAVGEMVSRVATSEEEKREILQIVSQVQL